MSLPSSSPPSPTEPSAALAALARKYRALAELRRAKARGEPPPGREVFRALAREFPGALRELDTVRFAELTARADALEAAAAGTPGALAPWMLYTHGYHAWMRAALALKPRVARLAAPPDDAAAARLAADAARHTGLAVDSAFVHEVAAPPAGRLRTVVLARVARGHGVAVDAVHAALFPPRGAGPDEVPPAEPG